MIIIIVVIIDHYPFSRVSLFRFSKFSLPQAARGHWPPNQNPADALVKKSRRLSPVVADSVHTTPTWRDIFAELENTTLYITTFNGLFSVNVNYINLVHSLQKVFVSCSRPDSCCQIFAGFGRNAYGSCTSVITDEWLCTCERHELIYCVKDVASIALLIKPGLYMWCITLHSDLVLVGLP